MENKIIELLNKQKRSDEISKILNIDKIKVDLFLIEYYYKCNPDPRRINIELIKSGIIDKNKNNKLSNIEIGNKYHFNSTIFGKILIKSGIKFRNSHYKNISILTKENIDIIINKFNQGITIKSIADDFDLNQDIISKLLKKYNIDTTPASFDIHIFDCIDTEEKAYWLGFLYADGSVSSKRNDVEISLKGFDIEHLYKFKKFVKSKKLPKLDIQNKYNRCRISLQNKYFKNILIKLGCIPNKSLILKHPILQKDLIRHFIRGYFDGDGCISYTYTNPGKSKKISISCKMLGTNNLLSWIQQILCELNINSYIRKDNNIFELSMSKNNSVKFSKFIYNNCNIYLTRKYERFLCFKHGINFAVQKSDFLDNDRAISVKAKNWIENNLNKKYNLVHVNTEIISESKESGKL